MGKWIGKCIDDVRELQKTTKYCRKANLMTYLNG